MLDPWLSRSQLTCRPSPLRSPFTVSIMRPEHGYIPPSPLLSQPLPPVPFPLPPTTSLSLGHGQCAQRPLRFGAASAPPSTCPDRFPAPPSTCPDRLPAPPSTCSDCLPAPPSTCPSLSLPSFHLPLPLPAPPSTFSDRFPAPPSTGPGRLPAPPWRQWSLAGVCLSFVSPDKLLLVRSAFDSPVLPRINCCHGLREGWKEGGWGGVGRGAWC